MDSFRSMAAHLFDGRPVVPDPRIFIKPPDTRPTLYEAWAAGHRWVLYRGLLCKISPMVGGPAGKLWLAHLGWWGEKGSQFHGFVPMTELVSPRVPNSTYFIALRRT